MIRGEMKGSSLNGSMSIVSKAEEGAAAVVEQDYCAGLSSELSSSYPGRDVGRKYRLAAGEDGGDGGGREEEDEDDEELELGLSLGAKKVTTNNNNNGRSNAAGGGPPWGEYCRILTAKDFPSMVASRGSPISSSSSSTSSSPLCGGGVGGAGTKRAADSAAPEVGSHTLSQVVGWPPIRAYRMNSLVNQSKENSSNDNNNNSHHKKTNGGHSANIHHNSIEENVNAKEFEKRGLAGSTLFVKVNMDGVPIGRKVDLNAHRSYDTLSLALEDMFHKPSTLSTPLRSAKASKLLDDSAEFVLTYEDKDGDWMLVGDVPWGMFLNTVKRLRIMRTLDANGLAPMFQSSKVGRLRSNPL